MMSSNVRQLIISGADGSAAAVAVAMAVSLQGSGIGITLLRPPESGQLRSVEEFRGGPQGFHARLGLDESTLYKQTNAVYGMGTRYHGLSEQAETAFVPLGEYGLTLRLVDFHHYVAKLRAEGGGHDYNDWSIAAAAAKAGRFDPAQTGVEPALRLLEYDLYVDHDRYVATMLKHASSHGVTIIEQAPVKVELDGTGMLEYLILDDGTQLHGDFFIDCSQDRSLIRYVAADDEFQDWSSWLSCDRLVSLQANSQTTPNLFASIEANDSGWLSQLSTHGKTAGAFVYDCADIDDTQAVTKLATWLPGADSGDAQVTHFRPGRYTRHWNKNCVAIGPAVAHLAPMEVSSLKLAHSSILRLLGMLPRSKDSPMLAAEFNRMSNAEIDSVRDYQLLRLALADRQTGQFWQKVQQAQWPDSLQQRIDLFRSRGRITLRDNEFYTKFNWISSFMNMGSWPASYDPLADVTDEQRMRTDLARFREMVQSVAG